MTYNIAHRIIVETPIFSRLIQELMSDDQYRLLQEALITRPDAGAIIRGSGGLRRIRWRLEGGGKRGGIRVIYYWLTADDQLRMLYAYKKSDQGDLTSDQLAVLKEVIQRW